MPKKDKPKPLWQYIDPLDTTYQLLRDLDGANANGVKIDNRAYGITGEVIRRYVEIDDQFEARLADVKAQQKKPKTKGKRNVVVIPPELSNQKSAAIEELTGGGWAAEGMIGLIISGCWRGTTPQKSPNKTLTRADVDISGVTFTWPQFSEFAGLALARTCGQYKGAPLCEREAKDAEENPETWERTRDAMREELNKIYNREWDREAIFKTIDALKPGATAQCIRAARNGIKKGNGILADCEPVNDYLLYMVAGADAGSAKAGELRRKAAKEVKTIFHKERYHIRNTGEKESIKSLMDMADDADQTADTKGKHKTKPVYYSKTRILNIIKKGESQHVEFKSTLRINLETGKKDFEMEYAVLKSIAAFLNTGDGVLLIGVNDDGKSIGIRHDKFEKQDKMDLHLINLINNHLGALSTHSVRTEFMSLNDLKIMIVSCSKSPRPIYLIGKDKQPCFYVRKGPSSRKLNVKEANEYIEQHF